MKDYPIETLDEWLHRIAIEQQQADRWDAQRAGETKKKIYIPPTPFYRPKHKAVRCTPPQDATEQIYTEMMKG